MPHSGHRHQEINGDKSFRGGQHMDNGVDDGRVVEYVNKSIAVSFGIVQVSVTICELTMLLE
jgi:hypothetical protein